MIIVQASDLNNKKYICISNWGKLVLQFGAALFRYKLRQTLLQNRAAITNWGIKLTCVTSWASFVLLQIRANVILQIGAASLLQIWATVITKYDNYYKLGHNMHYLGQKPC